MKFLIALLFPLNLFAQTPPPCSPPAAPPAPTYEVYPGCQAVPSVFKTTVIIDPAKGEKLDQYSAVFNTTKFITYGTHYILKAGDHGSLYSKYLKGTVADGWVWLDFEPGAYVKKVDTLSLSQLLITGADLRAGGLTTANGNNLVLANSKISGGDSLSWTAAQWIAAPNAVRSDGSTCVSITNNKIDSVRFGITFGTRKKVPSETSVKALVKGNTLRGVSADFMRGWASDITFENNVSTDGMVSQLDGDGNHDDFWQGAALGTEFSNVKLINNSFIERTGFYKGLYSQYQGLAVFDGVYRNMVITGNTVAASAYWLIAPSAVQGAVIENNTAVNTYTGLGRRGRIWVTNGKVAINSLAPTNVVCKNNVSNSFNSFCPATNNNISVPSGMGASYFTTFDVVGNKFDLTPLKGGPLDGKQAGSK